MPLLLTPKIAPKLCEALGISTKRLRRMEIVFNQVDAVEIKCFYHADDIATGAIVEVMKNYLLLGKPNG